MGTSVDGTGTLGDGNSLHHILHTSSVPECERRGTAADVISLGWPPRPHCPVLQTGVVPLEFQSVSRSIETARTSIQKGPTVIGGRLKQPMVEIEPFLHTETLGNPLTTLAVLHNYGPQVDFDASDRNAKRHKRLHSRMLMGNSNLKIYGTEVQKLRAWDKVSMATNMQSWETMNKDVMRVIQTAIETVKKHLMICTYEFGNYP